MKGSGNLGAGPGILGCLMWLGIIVVLVLVGSGIYAAVGLIRQNNEQAAASATATAFAPTVTAFAPYSSVMYSALNATLSGDAAVTYKPETSSGDQGVTLNKGAVTFHNVLVPTTGQYNLIINGDWTYVGYQTDNQLEDIIINGTKQSSVSPSNIDQGHYIALNQGDNTIEFVVHDPSLGPCYMWVTSIQISL